MSTFLIILICYAVFCVASVVIIRDFFIGLLRTFNSENSIIVKAIVCPFVLIILAILISLCPFIIIARTIILKQFPWQWKFESPKAPEKRLPSILISPYCINVKYDRKRNDSLRYVYYVEEEYNPELNDFFRRNYDKINEIFASHFGAPKGYAEMSEYEGNLKFVYLPLSEIDTLNEYMSEPKCHNESDRENFITTFYNGIFKNIFEEYRIYNTFGPITEKFAGLLWLQRGEQSHHGAKPMYEYNFYNLKYTNDGKMFEKIRNVLLSIKQTPEHFKPKQSMSCRIYVPYDENFLPSVFQVFYIEDKYHEAINNFFIRNNEKVKQLFRTEHADPYYDFIFYTKLYFTYLPLAVTAEHISELLKYQYPDLQTETQYTENIAKELASNIYSFFIDNLYISKDFEYKGIAGLIRFKKIEFINDTPEDGTIGKPYFMFAYWPLNYVDDNSFFNDIAEYIHSIGEDGTKYSRMPDNYNPEDEHDPDCADKYFSSRAYKLVEEIKERVDMLKAMGFNTMILQKLMLEPPKLSRLHITADYRIMLTDYDKEIKMTPLPKAVFFFFLRHPEGVVFKHLIDYKGELLEIYKNLTVSEDEQKIKESIDSITDSTKNSINEKCSRIREAFIKEICEDLAENYYITQDHKSNAELRLKLIILDRTMVIDDSGIIKL